MANSFPPAPRYGVHVFGVDARRHIRPYGGGLAERAVLLLSRMPRAVLLGCTAAYLHGLDVLPPGVTEERWPVEAAVPDGEERGAPPGTLLHRATVPPGEVTTACGFPATSPERTLLDCVRWLSRPQALAAADRLLRAGADRERVAAACTKLPGEGARPAREILDMADPRAETVGESWARCLVLDAGFPRPECRVPLFGGAVRLGMGYPELRQAMEYEDRPPHTPEEIRRHRWRRNDIGAAGWDVLAVTRESVLRDPEVFLRRLWRRMRDAGWRPGPEWLDTVRCRSDYIRMRYRRPRGNGAPTPV